MTQENQSNDKRPMINDKVYLDYRDNILVDKDNPILAFKAGRDRFTKKYQAIYAGLPHLGSINSEDAITWNFIRSLGLSNDFSALKDILKIKFENPKVLLWTMSFESKTNDLQYIVGSTIREIDGKHDGQITEPDIIIETNNHIIIIECKLGESNKYPTHLWESSKTSDGGSKLREKDYFKDDLFIGNLGYLTETYQLYRMAFYANELARKLNKKPLLVSLTNKSWWNKKKKDTETPAAIWGVFTKQVNADKIDLVNIFWQDLKIESDYKLASYLLNHRCLQI